MNDNTDTSKNLRLGIRLMYRPITGMLTAAMIAAFASLAVHAHGSSKRPITINVGVRHDAKPFSYVDVTSDSESILPGYSGYSIEVCRHVLKQMQLLPHYQNFEFRAADIRAMDRFKQLGVAGQLFMLCGPDSITEKRLTEHRSSHAVFLTGMTYAYLNPRSPLFPRGNHCGHVIGVVRGTTADTEGLKDIAARDLLMRFDRALDLEVSMNSARIEHSRIALFNLAKKELENSRVYLSRFYPPVPSTSPLFEERARRLSHINAMETMLEHTDPAIIDKALNTLEDQKNSIAGKIKDLMKATHRTINRDFAQRITTGECPRGFASLPIRKYESHNEGIAKFCEGFVLYYLADFDILKNKTQEFANCDIVMMRFTRSREVYGVYFPKNAYFDTDPESSKDIKINVANFYADFNHFLLMAMQGEHSKLEQIFEDEFGVQQKTAELEQFFDSFKLNMP
ncbi:MAG: substrate-binding periplasmic protein [Granulosicoccus sp.]